MDRACAGQLQQSAQARPVQPDRWPLRPTAVPCSVWGCAEPSSSAQGVARAAWRAQVPGPPQAAKLLVCNTSVQEPQSLRAS